jgi:hypothetical protein
MALDTVADYVAEARVLLQDKVQEYRYSDLELVNALNLGVMHARRMRSDLFLDSHGTVPQFTVDNIASGTPFPMDVQYRVVFILFMVGYAQLRDEEDTQDARAIGFITKFTQQLVSLS